jgi:uncharacterized membrane protein YcaP (DUF421 family)
LILGSILGRAIVTNQPLAASLAVALLILLLHRLLAWLTFLSHDAGSVIKGSPIALIHDGKKQDYNMKWQHITVHDISESLRLSLHSEDIGAIKDAYMERSGQISIILRKNQDQ